MISSDLFLKVDVVHSGPLHPALEGQHPRPQRASTEGLEVRILPGRISLLLLGVAVLFTALSLTGEALQPGLPGRLLTYLFGVDREANISSFYSALLLASCSMLLYIKYKSSRISQDRHWIYWIGLVIVFGYLAVDEAARLHEVPSPIISEYLAKLGVYIPAAWVLPAGVAVLVMGTLYLRFLFALPRRSALLFVGAGFVYLSGAIFFEMLAWHHRIQMAGRDDARYFSDATYVLLTSAEELLEMAGVILFIYGLLSHLARQGPVVMIRVASPIGAAATSMPKSR